LYGTTPYGGASGGGTVFAINTDGTGFRNLHSFTGGSDGANPFAGLILSGNTLYGTASSGGSSGSGTVFSIFIQPQLTLIPSGPYVILTWPTNYVGFNLQNHDESQCIGGLDHSYPGAGPPSASKTSSLIPSPAHSSFTD